MYCERKEMEESTMIKKQQNLIHCYQIRSIRSQIQKEKINYNHYIGEPPFTRGGFLESQLIDHFYVMDI